MEAISTLRGGKLPVQTSGGEGGAAAGAAAAVLGAVSPMGGVALFIQVSYDIQSTLLLWSGLSAF